MIIIFGLLAAAELYFANRRSRWPGLLMVLAAIPLNPFNFATYAVFVTANATPLQAFLEELTSWAIWASPVFVLLLIYGICRWRRNMKYGPPIKKKRTGKR